jgi:trimeric autotransporter adhesin
MKHPWFLVMVFTMLLIVSTGGLLQATEIQDIYLTSFGSGAGSGGAGVENNSFFGISAGANTTGDANSFFGSAAGVLNTGGAANSFFGMTAGNFNTSGSSNTFVGWATGYSNTSEFGNTFIGASANGAGGITNATAIGFLSQVTRSNSLVLGGVKGVNGAAEETFVGIGATNPDRQLVVEGTQAIGRFRRYYGTGDAFTRTFAPAFLFERARPTQISPTDIIAGDYLGKVQFRGRVGGNQVEYGALAFIANDTSQNGRFAFLDRDLTTERVTILNTGNVGIGTVAPQRLLHVAGDVQIDGDLIWTDPGAVPDYVFDRNYKLMGLDELEKFISEEKHLPNVPSASEIRGKGLNLNEFQLKLLEKIEELTLYTVRQEKTITSKNAEIAKMDARIAALEQMVERLAKQER